MTTPCCTTAALETCCAAEAKAECCGTEESVLLAQCLKPLVAGLPEPYREAIALTEYEGLTQAEAARRVNISVPGMKSRVQRARRQLGDLLMTCCRVELDARKAIRSVEKHGPCPC